MPEAPDVCFVFSQWRMSMLNSFSVLIGLFINLWVVSCLLPSRTHKKVRLCSSARWIIAPISNTTMNSCIAGSSSSIGSSTFQRGILISIIEGLKYPVSSHEVNKSVMKTLDAFLWKHHRDRDSESDSNNNKDTDAEETTRLVDQCFQISAILQSVASLSPIGAKNQLKTRQQLQHLAIELVLDGEDPTSRFVPLVFITATLALRETNTNSDNHVQSDSSRKIKRAVVSAIESTIHSEPNRATNRLAQNAIQLMLDATEPPLTESRNDFSPTCGVDLHIVTAMARIFNINCHTITKENRSTCEACAAAIRRVKNNCTVHNPTQKGDVTGALALASQVSPWDYLLPSTVVESAIQWQLWKAADDICTSATTHAAMIPSGPQLLSEAPSARLENAQMAVKKLIDASMERKMYRQADNLASKFYKSGGQERHLEARFLHACDTITSVIRKGAFPVIDKQVERIDKTVEKAVQEGMTSRVEGDIKCREIRMFALQKLQDSLKIEAAHRLAGLWDMELVYDEAALANAAALRQSTYIQWEEAYPEIDDPPEVVSTPQALIHAFDGFAGVNGARTMVYGFDVEWGDDDAGAALLQLATTKQCLLVDIPALSKTEDGVNALEKTVGRLFDSSSSSTKKVLVGFHCQQDLSQLLKSPCVRNGKHWFDGKSQSDVVVDLKLLVEQRNKSVTKSFGLSSCCEYYLGKPLDKCEQCSSWTFRPLSGQQRVYAALDAWACAAIYEKLLSSLSREK